MMGGSGSKKLSKEDLEFLIENTNFTKAQIKAWYKGFMVSLMLCILGFYNYILKSKRPSMTLKFINNTNAWFQDGELTPPILYKQNN